MATINDLAISVTEMSPEVLFDFIRTIRKRRRLAQQRPRKTSSKKPKTLDVGSLMNTLSNKERENLIKLLEDA